MEVGAIGAKNAGESGPGCFTRCLIFFGLQSVPLALVQIQVIELNRSEKGEH